MQQRDPLWEQVIAFMSRRWGGVELETTISAIELTWGIVVMLEPIAMERSQTFAPLFWGGIPPRLIAIPWLIAGGLNLIGLSLVYFNRGEMYVQNVIRCVGSLSSMFLWFWVALFTNDQQGSILLIIIASYLAAANIRIVAGSWQRLRLP